MPSFWLSLSDANRGLARHEDERRSRIQERFTNGGVRTDVRGENGVLLRRRLKTGLAGRDAECDLR